MAVKFHQVSNNTVWVDIVSLTCGYETLVTYLLIVTYIATSYQYTHTEEGMSMDVMAKECDVFGYRLQPVFPRHRHSPLTYTSALDDDVSV